MHCMIAASLEMSDDPNFLISLMFFGGSIRVEVIHEKCGGRMHRSDKQLFIRFMHDNKSSPVVFRNRINGIRILSVLGRKRTRCY